MGKGPKNDEELLDFLDDYPTLKKFLDTTDWELKANRMRNCVAHEKFYFDYRLSEIIFMDKKEKRIRLIEIRSRFITLSNFYVELLDILKESVPRIKSF